MMRRLPVFFVLDCSESMVGKKFHDMEEGLQMIVRSLRTDPHALETVYISVIAFAGIAKSIAPLLELVSFYPPKLPLGSGTNLGNALDVLMSEIDRSVIKTTADRKGDWRPIVYLLTDGKPTDNPQSSIERWAHKYSRKATMIAVGIGNSADLGILQSLSENVIFLENGNPDDFKKFINWVSASVVAQSKSVYEGADNKDLVKLDLSIMKLVKEPVTEIADETNVILIGRCQRTHKPYLIKYERKQNDVVSSEDRVALSWYELSGCYPIEEEYFTWSSHSSVDLKINTSELIGAPGCPHCGNISAFAMCSCGKLLCINGPGETVCPWCESTVNFIPGTSDDQGFDVGRKRG
jgi:uncharacterized protein YegL